MFQTWTSSVIHRSEKSAFLRITDEVQRWHYYNNRSPAGVEIHTPNECGLWWRLINNYPKPKSQPDSVRTVWVGTIGITSPLDLVLIDYTECTPDRRNYYGRVYYVINQMESGIRASIHNIISYSMRTTFSFIYILLLLFFVAVKRIVWSPPFVIIYHLNR